MVRPELTVAAIVEGRAEAGQTPGSFLLVEEIVRGNRVLNQPAGHVEDDESPLDAVIREVMEETGCSFAPTHLVGMYLWKSPRTADHILRIAIAGQVGERVPGSTLDEVICDTHWLPETEIRNSRKLRSPFVLRCLDDYLAGRSAPLETVHHLV